ncbi:GNAT family N-acetyltransferase [Paenibacillus sp. B2(2019)]|uniref:GNAT family N-acetyltransferase n=1 Tax=Paenibacillus sp. B2(2019) TaxID=2607754 RepID=UPI0011F38E49|nr:GNAT family N-acetyltransferase [Paenibacillus sp. B2(2019)]KAA1187177.1 GNAT family N-acetyltransferase [Paenibacillus sp. B2(2019)]
MPEVIYREIMKDDYDRIKELIDEAFGIHDFIQDNIFLDVILNLYLQSCILDSSFSKVAVKDNRVIGIILGKAYKDKHRLAKTHNYLSLAIAFIKIITANKENRKSAKELAKVQQTYKEIIQGKKDDFQGYIELFIVSEESRGLGVGKALMHHVSNYMRSLDVDSIYVYTDNRCNYGFYESQNFNRLNEKEIFLDSIQSKLLIFLYSHQIK